MSSVSEQLMMGNVTNNECYQQDTVQPITYTSTSTPTLIPTTVYSHVDNVTKCYRYSNTSSFESKVSSVNDFRKSVAMFYQHTGYGTNVINTHLNYLLETNYIVNEEYDAIMETLDLFDKEVDIYTCVLNTPYSEHMVPRSKVETPKKQLNLQSELKTASSAVSIIQFQPEQSTIDFFSSMSEDQLEGFWNLDTEFLTVRKELNPNSLVNPWDWEGNEHDNHDLHQAVSKLLSCVRYISQENSFITKEYTVHKDKDGTRKQIVYNQHSAKQWTVISKMTGAYKMWEWRYDSAGQKYRYDFFRKPKNVLDIPIDMSNFHYDVMDPEPYSPLGVKEPILNDGRVFRLFKGFQDQLLEHYDMDVIQPILDHIWIVIAKQNVKVYHYVLYWLAHAFRFPQEESTPMLLVGAPGAGKTWFVNFIADLLYGYNLSFIASNPKQITAHFNAHLLGKIFVSIPEVVGMNGYGIGVNGTINNKWRGIMSYLKPIITDPTIPITKKYVDTKLERNFKRVIMCSTYSDMIHLDLVDKRTMVNIEVSDVYSQSNPNGREYHAKLRESSTQHVANHFFTYLLRESAFDLDSATYHNILTDIPQI